MSFSAETPSPSVPPSRFISRILGLGLQAMMSIMVAARVARLLTITLLMLARGASDGQQINLGTVLHRIIDMGPKAIGLTLRFGISIGLVFGILLESWLNWADLLEFGVGESTEVMVEQVAPLFVAIMVASHSGAALAADLGIMVATREIEALRSLGLCPERLLVAPGILASVVAVPLLTVTMIACILLTFALYLQLTGIGSVALVVTLALNSVEPGEIGSALGKSALFGPLIVAIAAAQGLLGQPTTRQVGISVSSATVTMISTILLLNAALTLAF